MPLRGSLSNQSKTVCRTKVSTMFVRVKTFCHDTGYFNTQLTQAFAVASIFDRKAMMIAALSVVHAHTYKGLETS